MAEKKAKGKNTVLTYKGKPLVRSGNTIYYGNLDDKYVVVMQILNNRSIKGTEVAGKVTVQLVSTDEELRVRDRIVKKTEKDGLYNAIDIGSIWLERALSE